MKTPFSPLLISLCLLLTLMLACAKKDPAPTLPNPVISGVSPAEAFAGQVITIGGTNLDGAAVTVGAETVTTANASPTSVQFTVPAIAVGVQKITLTASGGTATFDNFKVIARPADAPKINTFAPAEGGAGALVVINGDGFSTVSTDIKVTINGRAATVTASNQQQLTVQIPEKAGSGPITVDVKGKQTTSASAFTYKFQIAGNTELYRITNNIQSTAVDPDDGTVYASLRNSSAIIIIRPNGTRQFVTLTDNGGVKHVSLTGISILKTGVGGSNDKVLVAASELKGIFYYQVGSITGVTTTLRGILFQGNDAIYNAPTFAIGVPQGATASYFLNGTYYMACFGNSTIVRSVRKDGVVSSPSIVGAGAGYNAGTVPTTNARFRGPVGIFLKNNLVYVADEGNHSVRVVDYDGGKVTTLFGTGAAGNTDGTFAQAKLNLPSNVAVDDNGLIYVTDRGNNSLRVFDTRSQTSQTILTGLNAPYGLTIDNSGALYLSEWSAGVNRVLKLTVK